MTDKTYENIKIEREGHVTFLVLNRPEKRNAMSPGLHYDVQDALKWLDDDAQTRRTGHRSWIGQSNCN